MKHSPSGFSQLVKIVAFYGNRKLATVCTRTHHRTLRWPRWIQSIYLHFISSTLVLIVYFHVCQVFSNGLFCIGPVCVCVGGGEISCIAVANAISVNRVTQRSTFLCFHAWISIKASTTHCGNDAGLYSDHKQSDALKCKVMLMLMECRKTWQLRAAGFLATDMSK